MSSARASVAARRAVVSHINPPPSTRPTAEVIRVAAEPAAPSTPVATSPSGTPRHVKARSWRWVVDKRSKVVIGVPSVPFEGRGNHCSGAAVGGPIPWSRVRSLFLEERCVSASKFRGFRIPWRGIEGFPSSFSRGRIGVLIRRCDVHHGSLPSRVGEVAHARAAAFGHGALSCVCGRSLE